MNHLNSLILEGNVESVKKMKNGDCQICMDSMRYAKHAGVPEKFTMSIDVYVNKGPLADSCLQNLTPESGLRVVGRMAGTQALGHYLVGEHIEFRSKEKPVLDPAT